MSLLYVGAGTDMSPLLLDDYNHYIFVDQCPDNSTGHWGFNVDGKPVPCVGFYTSVRRNIKMLGIDILHTEKGCNLWTFKLTRHDQPVTLEYYVNHVFPNIQKEKIVECTALFVRGYRPDPKVLEMTPLLTTIYSSGTECSKFAREAAKELGLSPAKLKMRLRYFDLLQHGESSNLLS